ncbi:YcnI family protein [Actinoplanes sp. NPDC049265]|uniref:YcnI family copper-binding membrane protein n=1 Tax=Actinoplanes sp. NPDC049265 TaxID=3363902 RepID=UPI00372395CB
MTLFKRAAVVAVSVAALTLAIAAPASAHVTVSSANAAQGGYAKATFRVPNESDTASTTKVEVTLPIQNAPVASVSIRPVPGWTAAVTKSPLAKPLDNHGTQIKEAVSKITWTAAADAAIKPGQFQEFDVSLGPLPEVDQMVFKTLQTYSDGNVVRWIDEPAAGGEEPESPAPVLKLAKAAPEGGAAPAAASGPAVSAQAAPAAETSNTGTALGLAGLALGVIALIIALLAFRRASTPAATTTSTTQEKVPAAK